MCQVRLANVLLEAGQIDRVVGNHWLRGCVGKVNLNWGRNGELLIWLGVEKGVLEDIFDCAVAREDELEQAHESRRKVSCMSFHLLQLADCLMEQVYSQHQLQNEHSD